MKTASNDTQKEDPKSKVGTIKEHNRNSLRKRLFIGIFKLTERSYRDENFQMQVSKVISNRTCILILCKYQVTNISF